MSLAFLELMTPGLPDEVARLAALGVRQVTVVPVFLGQGGHLLRDLPQLMDGLRAGYPQIGFTTAQAVGEDPRVLAALTEVCLSALDA